MSAMKKILIWFLTAQKFIFGFIVLFATIPITYNIADTVFDNSFLLVLSGLLLYTLTVIPLAYAVVIGYDRVIENLKMKKAAIQHETEPVEEETERTYTVKEEHSADKSSEEFTLIEVEKA